MGGGPSSAKGSIDGKVRGIISSSLSAYEETGKLSPLGTRSENILHSAGDARSHVNEKTGRYFGALFGHLEQGTTVDDPYYNPAAILDYGMSLYDSAAAITGSPKIGRGEALGILQGLKDIKGEDEQRGYLRGILSNHGVDLPDPAPGWGLFGLGE